MIMKYKTVSVAILTIFLILVIPRPILGDVFTDFDEFNETENSIEDPFEEYNRWMMTANDKIYSAVFRPITSGYAFVVPKIVRTSVSRVFKNTKFPLRFINNTLQLKFYDAGIESARFLINSTVGIAGLFDPAESWFKLPAKSEDFGQTLGIWGIGTGPYIVLPFFGPSNIRDAIGRLGGFFVDPIVLFIDQPESLIAKSTGFTNKTSLHREDYDTLKATSLDFYVAAKTAYTQHREIQIKE